MLDGHLADQQHEGGIEEAQLGLEERPAEGDLGGLRAPVALATGRGAREAARQRREVRALAEVARWEPGPLEPLLEYAPCGAGEVASPLVRAEPGRLPDDEHPCAGRTVGDGRRDCQVPALLTGPAGQDSCVQLLDAVHTLWWHRGAAPC